MKKRIKMSRPASRGSFRRGAVKTHRRNMPAPRRMPMRGGIRL